MGGAKWSKLSTDTTLDGLGFSSNVERDFPAWEAIEKLEQLLRACANNYRPNLMPPALVASYYLGASPAQLTKLYERWVAEICEPWPAEDPVAASVGYQDLEEHFGKVEYEERYYEYFRDCFTEEPDYPQLVKDHRDLLWPRFVKNQFRPLIELAAAVESDCDMVVSLALAIACSDPDGDVPDPVLEEVPKDGAVMATKIRTIAQKALKSQSYELVVAVHACAELFLRPRGNLLRFRTSMALLGSLEKYVDSHQSAFKKLDTVEGSDALVSEDHKLITYTRSRMVLEKLAI